MNVALATWAGRISPVFDVARQVLLVEADGGRVASRREAELPGADPQEQAARLAALGAQVLICGAISRPMAACLAAAGIRVLPFTAGPVETVLKAFLEGALPDPALCMPGCGRRRGFCGRRGQWRNGGPWAMRGRPWPAQQPRG